MLSILTPSLTHSLTHSLLLLPLLLLLYPGHTCSSIGEEKALNPRLTKSLSEFVGIMDSLNLPRPGKIDTAVPANLQCGTF